MIAALALALLLQEVPPPLPPPPDAKPVEVVVQNVDGEPCEPGRLPTSTTAEARAAWERLALAVSGGVVKPKPITAFDLALDLQLRIQENRTNDFKNARYAYMAPGYLLVDSGKGRRQVRGPKGDWLFDQTQPNERALVRLDVGRENAEDRRQLDEALDVARLFVLLVDARNVRIVRFVAAANPEAFVPTKLSSRAKELDWYELETPDVRPGVANVRGARILIGITKDTRLPALAVADDAAAPRRVNPTTSCIDLADWKPFEGWLLPKQILVSLPRIVEASGAGGAVSRVADGWRKEPAMDLFVLSASPGTALTPADFLPPDPRR